MSLKSRWSINIARLALLVLMIGTWQFLAGRYVSKLFISSPFDIAMVLGSWIGSGRLFAHVWITAAEAFLGFLVGGFAGIALGILLGRNETLSAVLDPFITAFYCLPKVALAPLFILWFGIDLEMKVILTATIIFFLVFTNTYMGVREVSPELITIMKLMGAKERHVLTKVVIPSAFVWVVAGLRLSVPYALIGAVVGEMVASNRGLGYLMIDSAGQFNTAGVFAALFAIMILAFILNFFVEIVERVMLPWKDAKLSADTTT